MKPYTIKSAIYDRPGYCYISLTDWNFRKNADYLGRLRVQVKKGGQVVADRIVVRKNWVKYCKLKKPKAYYFKNDPMMWFYGYLPLGIDKQFQPKTIKEKEEDKLRELALSL